MHRASVGKPAPDFTATAVMDGKLKEISLSAYTAANHWVALIFFPKAWSFVCPTEIRAYSERLEEFLYTRSCAVVFASTDTELCLRAWNHTNEMEGGLGGVHVPLMSDSNHKISRDYGVLLEDQGVAERALFIIDPKGNVRNITISDADVGRSVDETLRIIDALAFKDEYGEGCPVNWKKGDAGLKMAEQTKVDGPLDVKKPSWSEWARPKLQRAWSGQSQRSIGSGANRLSATLTVTPPSPLVSPTSSGFDMMDRNMEAAMANHHIGLAA
ncbi:thioredoxin-like protein [Aureobasidium sp. EXF-3400]|nr:thioredoxin-like protein [Aureobasidium sp. EXF-12344]KAI4785058.1 thioredoxin-like protein [Aureobasidium sp. EXF-3400]